VLSEKEWPSWNTKARDILKSDPGFGTSPDNIDIFTVRERPISVSEKLYNEFKAERNFFGRAAAIRSFVSRKDPELDSEYFAEMFSYLTSFLKPSTHTSEQTMAAFFLIKELADKYPHLGANLPMSFTDIIKGVNDIPGLFYGLKDGKFKEEFLRHLQTYVPAWADIFVELFPRTILPSIISQLEKEGYAEKLTGMALDCFERFRERREAAVWLFKNASNSEWFKAANIGFERQLIVLIHILDLTYRDIENQRETTEARKINKQVYTILFKEGVLASFINGADTDTITRIYTFINDVKNLDPQDKINLRSKIQGLHPDFKFLDIVEKRISQGLIVTKIKYEEKQRQLAHIQNIEIPANSKEIEAALLHGDLSENAEYKAAKEKQELLTSKVGQLKEDIERSKIFDPATIDTSRVSFGTVAVLQNQSKNRKEEYTILGPWESDPENNIISYQTPFGKAMLGKTPGEYFNFLSDGEKNSYMVEEIRAAAF
jgi:transcription elongation factor GreA